MCEFITITAIAVLMLLASLIAAHYFMTQIGFTATEVEHESTIPNDLTY